MKQTIPDKVDKFFSKYPSYHYKKREIILRADEAPLGVYYIKKGYVRSYVINKSGKEFTFNIFKPGSYFPLIWFISNEPNTYNYEAMTSVEIRRAPKKDVRLFLRKNNEVLFHLTKRLGIGMHGILSRMEGLLLSDARKKVSSTLFMLSSRFGQRNGESHLEIHLNFTHQDIANLAGISRETTSLELKKLEKEGIISKKRNRIIIIRSVKLKREMHG